jgi:hypothetical protein
MYLHALILRTTRVEGRGAATIHDVTIFDIPAPSAPTTSPALEELGAKKNDVKSTLERSKRLLASLDTFSGSLSVEHLDPPSKLSAVLAAYEENAKPLQKTIFHSEKELKKLQDEYNAERRKLSTPHDDARLRVGASVGVFAQAEGELEITLIYGRLSFRPTSYAKSYSFLGSSSCIPS